MALFSGIVQCFFFLAIFQAILHQSWPKAPKFLALRKIHALQKVNFWYDVLIKSLFSFEFFHLFEIGFSFTVYHYQNPFNGILCAVYADYYYCSLFQLHKCPRKEMNGNKTNLFSYGHWINFFFFVLDISKINEIDFYDTKNVNIDVFCSWLVIVLYVTNRIDKMNIQSWYKVKETLAHILFAIYRKLTWEMVFMCTCLIFVFYYLFIYFSCYCMCRVLAKWMQLIRIVSRAKNRLGMHRKRRFVCIWGLLTHPPAEKRWRFVSVQLSSWQNVSTGCNFSLLIHSKKKC